MTHGTEAVVTINGYALCSQWDDQVERIRDTELAERLGYARAREIRTRIKRLEAVGELPGVCCTVQQTGSKGGRPGVEYWLTQEEALIVIMGCETAIARRITREVVQVFMAWRAGKLAAATDPRLVETVAALQRELQALQAKVTELSEGVISRAMLCQLRSEVRRISVLECALRRWPSKRSATAGIYRDMGQAVGWGGKGQPWKFLPAGLTHDAFVALRQREAGRDHRSGARPRA